MCGGKSHAVHTPVKAEELKLHIFLSFLLDLSNSNRPWQHSRRTPVVDCLTRWRQQLFYLVRCGGFSPLIKNMNLEQL